MLSSGLSKKIFLRLILIFAFCFLCHILPSEAAIRTLELSDEAAKEIKGAYEESWLTQLDHTRKKLEEKYGTRFAYLFNFAQQLVLKDKTYAGKAPNLWYMNFAVEQKLWKDALATVELEMDKNKGVDKLIPTYSIFNSNTGKNASPYIPTLYVEQKAFQGKTDLIFGKTDLSNWFDTNAVANSADTQFLSSSLINSITIPFPAKGLAGMVKFQPTDYFYLQSGAATAEATSTKVGLNNGFDSTLFLNEFGITPKIFGKLEGNYRFIYYFRHKKSGMIMDENQVKNQEGGFSLSFDQAVSERLTLFMRYGFSDPKLNDIQYAWSAGWQLSEPIKGRKNDCLAFGLAQSIFGRDFRAYNNSLDMPIASRETMLEAYYSLAMSDLISLSADLQAVVDPEGNSAAENPMVASVRMLVVF